MAALYSDFEVELHHSHLTKLNVFVRHSVINIPSLIHLEVQRASESVHLSNCAPKVLSVSNDVRQFTTVDVNWSSLEELRFYSNHIDYWGFVDKLPKDLVVKTVPHSKDLAFRVIDVSSLLYSHRQLIHPYYIGRTSR